MMAAMKYFGLHGHEEVLANAPRSKLSADYITALTNDTGYPFKPRGVFLGAWLRRSHLSIYSWVMQGDNERPRKDQSIDRPAEAWGLSLDCDMQTGPAPKGLGQH